MDITINNKLHQSIFKNFFEKQKFLQIFKANSYAFRKLSNLKSPYQVHKIKTL